MILRLKSEASVLRLYSGLEALRWHWLLPPVFTELP